MEGLVTTGSRFRGITHVFLDLDDTLVVDEAGAWTAFRAAGALARARRGVDPEEVARACRYEARRLWFALKERRPELVRTGISSWEALWTPVPVRELPWWDTVAADVEVYRRQAWIEALGVVGVNDPALAAEMAAVALAARHSALVPFPDVPGTLDDLSAGWPLGVITNGLPAGQRMKLERAGLASYFAVVAVSSAIGEPKPAPDAFLAALRWADCAPEHAVMVGNSLESDVAGARAAGVSAVWLNRDGAPRESGPEPDAEIRSLAELRPLLEAAGAAPHR